MPPRQQQSIEDRAVEEVVTEDEANVKAIAMQAGPPPDSRRLSESDEDDAWATTDDLVDEDDLAQRLAVQGLSAEEAQALLVVKLRPEWMPLFMQPTQDLMVAQQRAKAAKFAFRWSLLEDLDPEEQVEVADRLNRRYQKRMTAMQEQMGG